MWLFWPLKLCLRISEFWTPCSLPCGVLDKCNLCPTNSLRLSFRGPNNHKSSPITIAMKRKKRQKKIPCSPFTCHLSHVTCHLSPVKCPMSYATCHMSHVTCHYENSHSNRPSSLLHLHIAL